MDLGAAEQPAIVVAVVALAIVLQHFLRHPPRRPRAAASPRGHWQRQAGVGLLLVAVSLGAARWLARDGESLGLTWGTTHRVLGWAALVAGVMALGSFVGSRSEGFVEHYPEAPVERWTTKRWLANAGAWAIYLAGYELLFRGLCLSVLVEAWGVSSGVAVTTALYAVAHLPKNMSESLGSFPMGVVLAALTLGSGSLGAAWMVHLLMALSADGFALLGRSDADSSERHGAVGDVDPAHATAQRSRG